MRYYLFSSKPCSVKLDGKFVGIANGNLSYFEREGQTELLLSPVNGEYDYTISALPLHPKKTNNMQFIDLYGDILIIPSFLKKQKNRHEILFDKSFENDHLKVSAFCLGEEKVLVANDNGQIYTQLDALYSHSRFFTLRSENKLLLKIQHSDAITVLIYDVGGCPKLLFFQSGELLKQTEREIIICKRTNLICIDKIFYTISLCNLAVKREYQKITQPNLLHPNLIPYAFLQAVQYSFELDCFLSEDVAQNKKFISDFLGRFDAIIPLQSSPDKLKHYAILVGERAKVVECTLIDRLISNLSIL